jgi:signal peptidase I
MSNQRGEASIATATTHRTKGVVREWTEFLVTLVIMVFFIRVTTVEAFRIPTCSMENTLKVGDFLLVNKFIYGIRTPEWIGIPFTDIGFKLPSTRLPAPAHVKQGDIIVFKFPQDTTLNFIKRCIALPGQTLEIRNRRVFVDSVEFGLPPDGQFTSGTPQRVGFKESGIFGPAGNMWNHDNFGPIMVPEGHYFVMGDNRDNSADSRYWGFLPERNILGKALIIYFSWDRNVPLSEFYSSIRFSRIGNWIE